MPGESIIIESEPWTGDDIGGSGEMPDTPLYYIGILLLVILAAGAIMMFMNSGFYTRAKHSFSMLIGWS